jgi:hypothetical protein
VNEEPYVFVDEKFMTAQEKWRVLRAWRRFIRGGFEWEKFTEATYHHVIQHCSFIAHYDRGGFWDFYFNSDHPNDLARFLNQFGGDKRSAEYGWTGWLKGPTGADLNQAMCREMEVIYPALVQVLDGLTRQYQAAVVRWRESAPAMALLAPPIFRINAEIRAMLAIASMATASMAVAAGHAPDIREAAGPEMVSRPAAVLELHGAPEQLSLWDWDAAPGKAGDPLAGEQCAVCRALPQVKPGTWYVIDGTLYCPDCVPVIRAGEETAEREVSMLHNKALIE